MFRVIFSAAIMLFLSIVAAAAQCSSYPYTLTNGTTADANQVMQNFDCAARTSGATLFSTTLRDTTGVIGNYAGGMSVALGIESTSASGYGGGIQYRVNPVGVSYPAAFISAENSNNAGANDGGQLFLWTAAEDGSHTLARRMTISASGNVGIATVGPSYTLHVNGSVAGVGAYVNLSDGRLKKNVTPLTGGLALVSRIQPVRYEWKSTRERTVGKDLKLDTGVRQIGFIAQDIAEIIPEAVSKDKSKNAIMSVAESKLVPVLLAAIKELKITQDAQAREIGSLKAQVTAMSRRSGLQTAAMK